MRVPNGFHVSSDYTGDGIGLTRAEVEEERRAKGEAIHGQARKRGPRRIATPTKHPFDEMLNTIGVLEWIKPICKERGVMICELPRGTKAARVQAVRKLIYAKLREMEWSYVQIAQLFEYSSHTQIMDALNGGNKRGKRATPKTSRRVIK